MKIEFHGAASEVGRSCIQIMLDSGERYLLDVGIKFQEDGFLLPEKVLEIHKLDGVFLSHAHLDHSGGLPLFEHKDLKGPIFCTKQTLAITRVLLKDSYKIARIRRLHPAYNHLDLKEVQKDAVFVDFDKWYTHKSLKFMYLNAGHVPGSAMILIEAEGKRILYTADFNLRKTVLMKNCTITDAIKEKPIDLLISESTYGDKDLPDRNILEQKFIKSIEQTISNGGSVLIPVFSLGRAQEALIMLAQKKWPVKIYLDGMAKSITRQVLETPGKYTDNQDVLNKMFYKTVEWIGSDRHRKDAIQKGGIFVTTSGMLQGGPVLSYLHELWHDPRNKIMLMGFQCKRTNGRMLLEEGFVYLEGWKTVVKCQVEKFDFSGHSEKESIKEFVKQISPKHVFFQHGDEEAVIALKKWADASIVGKAYAPVVGSVYEFH